MAEMHSYYGYVRSQLDAIILFEACRLGLLPRIRRRLSERERLQISSGKVYIWDEQEAGMRRWTDGKSWSASRVSGAFLSYREMDSTPRPTPETENSERGSGISVNSTVHNAVNNTTHNPAHNPSSPRKRKKAPASDDPNIEETEEGYRYKKNGLYKQSFSITTATNLKLHLISYYTKDDVNAGKLIQPCMDPKLKNIVIPPNLYPDAPPGGLAVPALTRIPLEPTMNTNYGPLLPEVASITGNCEVKTETSGGCRGSPNSRALQSATHQLVANYTTEERPQIDRSPSLSALTVSSDNSFISEGTNTPASGRSIIPSLPPFVQRSNSSREVFAEDKRVIGILDRALII